MKKINEQKIRECLAVCVAVVSICVVCGLCQQIEYVSMYTL